MLNNTHAKLVPRVRLAHATLWAAALSILTAVHAQDKDKFTPSKVTSDLKGGVDAGAAAVRCAELVAKRQKALDTVSWYRDLRKQGLGPLGVALEAAAYTAKLNEGKYADVAEDATRLSIGIGACAAAGLACPAWKFGETVGDVINQIPLHWINGGTDHRTINEAWTDFLVEQYIDFRDNQQPIFQYTEPSTGPRRHTRTKPYFDMQERLKRAERVAAIRQQQAEEAIRQATAAAVALRCDIPSTDPLQTPSGVVPLLKAAQRVAPMSTSKPRQHTTAPGFLNCDLSDTGALEQLQANDPNAYDAMMARCLK